MADHRAARPADVRQHGAMEYSAAPVDLDVVRRYRLDRLRGEMRKRDVAALLLFDQINTRYATDATNMQVWCSHYETRCVFVALEGPVVLFDYANHPYLAEGLPTVDDTDDDTVTERKVGPITVTGDGPLVVREKSHTAAPMTLDQALYEMELVGHDFYLFVDKESERPAVVYRRRGYDYGVISLDVAG